jgi:uncharacterized membrane protein YphA (DoxX/SURF4 family)
MWGTDLTTTITGEGQAAVFVAVDHCSAECVGIHAAARATRFEALEPIRQGVRGYFGGFAKGVARGLAVRHDHGSQYLSDTFQHELAFLDIESSPALVRVYLTEVAIGISLMLGFCSRLGALAGVGMAVNLWRGLYSAPGEWPWAYFFLVVIQLLFVVDPPGRSLGADVLLQESVLQISPRGTAVVRGIG